METRLAEVRERKGIKQAELARRVGLSRGQVANLEAGNRTMDLPTLRKFASTLEVPVVELLLPEDAPEYPEESEMLLLREMRNTAAYDPRAMLIAARAVVAVAATVREVMQAPKELRGEPETLAQLTRQWNGMDDQERQRAVTLLETAREFRRD